MVSALTSLVNFTLSGLPLLTFLPVGLALVIGRLVFMGLATLIITYAGGY